MQAAAATRVWGFRVRDPGSSSIRCRGGGGRGGQRRGAGGGERPNRSRGRTGTAGTPDIDLKRVKSVFLVIQCGMNLETIFTRQGPGKCLSDGRVTGRLPRDVDGATIPGGKREVIDADLWDTLNRELTEELGPENHIFLEAFFKAHEDYKHELFSSLDGGFYSLW